MIAQAPRWAPEQESNIASHVSCLKEAGLSWEKELPTGRWPPERDTRKQGCKEGGGAWSGRGVALGGPGGGHGPNGAPAGSESTSAQTPRWRATRRTPVAGPSPSAARDVSPAAPGVTAGPAPSPVGSPPLGGATGPRAGLCRGSARRRPSPCVPRVAASAPSRKRTPFRPHRSLPGPPRAGQGPPPGVNAEVSSAEGAARGPSRPARRLCAARTPFLEVTWGSDGEFTRSLLRGRFHKYTA